MRKYQFFDSDESTLDYITNELIAILEDDRNDCEGFGDTEQAAELRQKIDDIQLWRNRFDNGELIDSFDREKAIKAIVKYRVEDAQGAGETENYLEGMYAHGFRGYREWSNDELKEELEFLDIELEAES